MKQACNTCHNFYDNLYQRSDCPHKEFPQPCKEHGRKNCGNPECNKGTLVLMEERERKDGTR